ncbi:SDR family NAD(P)-dependent oxidoreductase [Rhodococcus globerulus]|uniref:3-oxoacyl-[acyl-carrier-protein] reductase MabA n=1 Tax=Rhodococcus globerulus TaxID=33008 RepID=A0ABU4C2T6_RHOGO|nr:SDR family oxidoreductase [Rhodococcus globerulus]MDV6270808.1 SDR family oxidoreductase [Rhodococcus globerulus]
MTPSEANYRHRDHTAVITGVGSTTGIGFAAAILLGRGGATVIVTSTTARVHKRVAELRKAGVNAFGIEGNLVDPTSAQGVVDFALAQTGRIDILVNNAGLTEVGSALRSMALADLADIDWSNAIASNLTTAFNATRSVLPAMVERRYGRIVNIASTSGPINAYPADAAYHAAKAGLVGLTRSVAIDYAKMGITSNAVAPGWIETASTTPSEITAAKCSPLGRSGTAFEVAHAIASLTAAEASYITGQILVVDGGNSIQENHANRTP